jgi:hypothetical protein
MSDRFDSLGGAYLRFSVATAVGAWTMLFIGLGIGHFTRHIAGPLFAILVGLLVGIGTYRSF